MMGRRATCVAVWLLWLAHAAAPCLLAQTPSTRPAEHRAAGAFDAREFGARGDGRTNDTNAIQQAIDAAAATGGATVILPAGRYLSGTLRLRSHVTLQIAEGATLLGSTDLDDYPRIFPAYRSHSDTYVCQALIYAEDAENIAITGRGTIDGQGDADVFVHPTDPGDRPYGLRPFLVRFVTCRRVLVRDVTLCDSPMWVQQYLACDDVVIENISVFSHTNRNNDMLDLDGCHNVRVSGCTGDTGDDAITLKSSSNRACRNITITNCVVSSHCNAIKCGTESNGGFENITISNCAIRPSATKTWNGHYSAGLAGIALELVDGGSLNRIVVSNITIEGTQSPIFLRLGNRARPPTKDAPKPGIGTLRNVIIDNVIATGASNLGCPIAGLPDHPIENVTLSNIKITAAGGGVKDKVGLDVPERPDAYPESGMFGALPAYGFYIRHVTGLTLDNVDVRTEAPDQRSAIVCDDVQHLVVRGFSAQVAHDAAPVVWFNDTTAALITSCQAPANTDVFLQITGRSDRINAMANDLHAATKPFSLVDDLSPSILYESSNNTTK